MVEASLDARSAVAAVIAMGEACARRGWTPATAGNFSARIAGNRIAMTRTGTDKGALGPQDVLELPLDRPPPREASAEAPVHWTLYRAHPEIGAIVHVHSPAATLLSAMPETGETIRLAGWELLKAIEGVKTHEAAIAVPVYANTQDMEGFAAALEVDPRVPALVLAGHGVYAWGAGPREALRHVEALEYLFALELERRRHQR